MCTGRSIAWTLAAAALLAAPGAGQETTPALAAIKKLCVEKFTAEGTEGAHARELAIASLFASKRFTVSENCAKADAILKGAVTEKREQRFRSESDSLDFGEASSRADSSLKTSVSARGGVSERLASSETGSQASVTLRIVDREGEVLWAHTQESRGGKVKSPVADAVDRGVKQLLREIEKTATKAKPPK